MGFIENIKKFALGGNTSSKVDEPTEENVSEEASQYDNVDPEKLGTEIMNEYLGFLDNMNKDLYLSDLLIFRAKKESLKSFSLGMDLPDENETAMDLASRAGFYDELAKKPFYDKIPFKQDLLKWLPDVHMLHEFKVNLTTNSADINAEFDINDTTKIGGNVKLEQNNKTIKPTGNIKLTKTF